MSIGPETITVHLKDIGYNFRVDVVYQAFPANDIIRRQARITNETGQPVNLESAQSAVWYLPMGDAYRLSYLTGRWAGETQLIRQPIQPGSKVLESRRGTTSHEANPWFAIDAGRRGRGTRPRVVRRSGLERRVENGGGADAAPAGERHRRL